MVQKIYQYQVASEWKTLGIFMFCKVVIKTINIFFCLDGPIKECT